MEQQPNVTNIVLRDYKLYSSDIANRADELRSIVASKFNLENESQLMILLRSLSREADHIRVDDGGSSQIVLLNNLTVLDEKLKKLEQKYLGSL